MKTTHKKLTLRRETLRQLDSESLARVQGGTLQASLQGASQNMSCTDTSLGPSRVSIWSTID